MDRQIVDSDRLMIESSPQASLKTPEMRAERATASR
jgi:hypothetical protein